MCRLQEGRLREMFVECLGKCNEDWPKSSEINIIKNFCMNIIQIWFTKTKKKNYIHVHKLT